MVTGTNTAMPSTNMEQVAPTKRASDNRRSNKPIMEKRRRARINNSLNELKTLILDAMKKDPARHSKLEKADILEMTVKHLQTLQRQQAAGEPSPAGKFRAGFGECAAEVGRFPGLEAGVRRRLLQHLAACLGAKDAPLPDGVQLVPTRLPNGDLALVLPAPMPLLVPIPQRTASTASASSASSHYSPSHSPEPDAYPKPLSLVVRRCADAPADDKPWRPW